VLFILNIFFKFITFVDFRGIYTSVVDFVFKRPVMVFRFRNILVWVFRNIKKVVAAVHNKFGNLGS